MSPRTTFQVIPLSEIPSSDHESEQRAVVLVVDDEPIIADTLAAILRTHSYVATAAYNGEDALAMAEVVPPNFLITDIMMPGMNGIELAIRVRDLAPDCKVLLFSADAESFSNDPALARHQFALVPKPLHPRELLAYMSHQESLVPQTAKIA
jgi:CheY-like chemotaxis protein